MIHYFNNPSTQLLQRIFLRGVDYKYSNFAWPPKAENYTLSHCKMVSKASKCHHNQKTHFLSKKSYQPQCIVKLLWICEIIFIAKLWQNYRVRTVASCAGATAATVSPLPVSLCNISELRQKFIANGGASIDCKFVLSL